MGTIRLLTYNIKMLPDIARINAFWEKVMRDPDRAKAIIKQLTNKKTGRWDIVCLQEVFDEDRRKQIHTGLSASVSGERIYRHFVAKSDDGDFLQEDSGLFFASQHPVEVHRFQEYNDAVEEDRFSDKGILSVALDTRRVLSGTKIVVFTTHMQADAHNATTRAKQVAQLRKYMQSTLSRIADPASYGVVVCGDLNIIAELNDVDDTLVCPTDEYIQLCSALGDARDLYRRAHATDLGATWDPENNSKMIKDRTRKKRLDYIFAIDSIPHADATKPRIRFGQLNARSVNVERFPHAIAGSLSDHFGVSVELEVV